MHIGKRIKEVLREQGHNVSWLAARIPCKRSNVYNIFRRCNIDAGLLYSISLVMEYNFFADLSTVFEREASSSDKAVVSSVA